MRIEFDAGKSARNVAERGLDFRDAELIFTGFELTVEDLRRPYGEPRYFTLGWLHTKLIAVTWTPRVVGGEPVRRIISMRRANEREVTSYLEQLSQG